MRAKEASAKLEPAEIRRARHEIVALIAGAFCTSVAAVYLIAWISGGMVEFVGSAICMKANTSVCLLLLGVALITIVWSKGGRLGKLLCWICAVTALVIGVGTLVENSWQVDLGIDHIFAGTPAIHSSRMGVPASLGVVMAALAILMLSSRGENCSVVAQTLGLCVCFIASFGAIGYLYEIEALYGVAGYTRISLPTAVTLLTLGVGLLCACPGEGLMTTVTSDDPGGIIIRRLLLPLLLLLVTLGWLRTAVERSGAVSAATATGLLIIAFGAVFTVLLYYGGVSLSRAAKAERTAQADLRTSEERHRIAAEELEAIMDAVPAGILVAYDPECRVITGNAQAHEIFGVPAHEEISSALGRYFRLYRNGRELELEELPLQMAAASGRTVSDQKLEVLRNDGTCRSLLVTASPLHNPDGTIRGLAGVVEDVTEQQKAEVALQESETKFRAVFEHAAVGMGRVEFAEARWIDVNDAFCRMLGYSAEELRVTPWPKITYPEDIDLDLIPFRRMAAGELDNYTVEKRFIHKRGHLVWARLALSLVRDANRKPDYEIAIIEDITDRKNAEKALHESQEQFRIVAEHARTVIVIMQENRIVYANPFLAEVTGYSLKELLSMRFVDIVHPKYRDAMKEYARRRYRNEEAPLRYEFALLTKGGQSRWMDFSPRVIDYSGQPAIVGTAHDITERKQMEEELRSAQRNAEQARAVAEDASRAKDHFLAVLSHELRTPLTPVVATVTMLQEDERIKDEELLEGLEIIRRNVEMEAGLIDDLLDVTRIVRGKIELHRKPLILSRVVSLASDVCRPEVEAKMQNMVLDYEGCGKCAVLGDAARLQQVFWNLIKNAVKFTPIGGTISARCLCEADSAVVEVTDTGEGIDPAILPDIFTAFEQGGARVTRQFGGLGLGLTITRGLVEMHGGQIFAYSEGKGKGATFRVRLPLYSSETKSAPGIEDEGGGRPASVSLLQPHPLRILLVEDHPDTVRIMQRLLKSQGHQVETAGGVNAALKLEEEKPFDLLVSDLGLPDGSGLDLIRALRMRGHREPAIALSGYGQEDDFQRSRAAGFNEHIVKPVDGRRLREVIIRVTREQDHGV